MEHINNIITTVINNFDFSFILIVNVLTYSIIKFIDKINKDRNVSRNQKRIILLLSIIIITCSYISSGYDNNIVLLNSAILCPISWSWIIKPIFIKLGIDYKKIDNYLK